MFRKMCFNVNSALSTMQACSSEMKILAASHLRLSSAVVLVEPPLWSHSVGLLTIDNELDCEVNMGSEAVVCETVRSHASTRGPVSSVSRV